MFHDHSMHLNAARLISIQLGPASSRLLLINAFLLSTPIALLWDKAITMQVSTPCLRALVYIPLTSTTSIDAETHDGCTNSEVAQTLDSTSKSIGAASAFSASNVAQVAGRRSEAKVHASATIIPGQSGR